MYTAFSRRSFRCRLAFFIIFFFLLLSCAHLRGRTCAPCVIRQNNRVTRPFHLPVALVFHRPIIVWSRLLQQYAFHDDRVDHELPAQQQRKYALSFVAYFCLFYPRTTIAMCVYVSMVVYPVTGSGGNMVNPINETLDIKDPSLVWQQSGQYLPDSGIQSGGSTQTHSITTKEDDIERDRLLYDLDHGFSQSFPHDQVEGS